MTNNFDIYEHSDWITGGNPVKRPVARYPERTVAHQRSIIAHKLRPMSVGNGKKQQR